MSTFESLTRDELIKECQKLTSHVNQLRSIIHKRQYATKRIQRPFNFELYNKRHVFLRIAYVGWMHDGFVSQETTTNTIENIIFEALQRTRLIDVRQNSNYHRCGRTDKAIFSSSYYYSLVILAESKSMDKDDEIRARKRQERERKRKELREQAEKQKRFGLTPEKKRKLRTLIRKKAAEDLKNEASQSAQRKATYMAEKVAPLPADFNDFDESKLSALCKELHKIIEALESDKYDIEYKIRITDLEINELTIKINDIAGGKFTKPLLKKVSQVEGKLNKLSKKEQSEQDFRKTLKSTGIKKYALEEEEREEKVNLRDQLKHVERHEEELD